MGEHTQGSSIGIKRIHGREFAVGVFLIAVGYFLPLPVNVITMKVSEYIRLALEKWDRMDLMIAAVRLVIMNYLRACPLYLGAFYISESIEFRCGGRRDRLPNLVLIFMLLFAIYRSMEYIHHFPYDLSLAAVVLSLTVLLFRQADYQYIALYKKTLLLSTLVLAFQFMDIMTSLSMLPVGRGEMSRLIKQISVFLEADALLNVIGVIGFTLFMLFTVLIFLLLRDENRLQELHRLRNENLEQEHRTQMSELKARTYQEMQYLVHDLKSPLTSVQTLVGVMKLTVNTADPEKNLNYLNRIEQAMERMSGMVSAILYEKRWTRIKVKEIVDIALAQFSVVDAANTVHVKNTAAESYILVNRILFPRVLVNLLQNAAEAKSPERELEIVLKTERGEEEGRASVRISVADNGRGIRKENEAEIWERGVSGKCSSGLGLAFVKQVTEASGGRIRMNSISGEGTEFELILPEMEDEDGDEEERADSLY